MSSGKSLVNAPALFFTVSAAMLLTMVYLSRDYGVTFDELDQDLYGQKVYAYFASGFADTSALTFKNLFLYGGLFEWLAACVEKTGVFANAMLARHALNAVFGWLAVHFVGLSAGRIAGPKAALAGLGLMVCCPVFFGHCMNNPKDVPLAAFFAMTLYYLLSAEPVYPYFRTKTWIMLAISIALAINIRVAGTMLFADVGLVVAALVLWNRDFGLKTLGRLGGRYALLVAAGLLGGTIFWPWAQQNPWLRPLMALQAFSHFAAWNQQVLFEGQSILAANLPRSYILKHFLIQTPPLLLALFGGAIYLALLPRSPVRRQIWICLCCLLVPLLAMLVTHPTLYDGLRHFLFLYPVVVLLAAVALSQLWERLSSAGPWRYGVYGAVVLGVLEPVSFSVRNHPFQASYFSPVIGGVDGAFGNYEMDFWGSCIYQGLQWAEAQRVGAEPKTVAIAWRNYWEFYGDVFPNLRHTGQADYQIVPMRDSATKLRALVARSNLLHKVTVDDVPLCLVFDGHHQVTARVF